MKAKIITLVSDPSKNFIAEELANEVKKRIPGLEIIEGNEGFDFPLFIVGTGGVENQFKEIYMNFSSPYVILFNEFNNSLPASLEILSFLNGKKLRGNLIDINNLSEEMLKEIFPFLGERIGLIGKSSDWLIASQYPEKLFSERFKIEVTYIPIEEAINEFSRVSEIEAKRLAEDFSKDAKKIYGVDLFEITKAFKFYLALKDVIQKYKLNYVSVRCFDIIQPLNTTGCLALSKLNDKGIIAGCEGDLPSTLSMIFLKKVSQKTPFMANISYIKESESHISAVLAHCTIGTTAVNGFNLRTHFETDKGVGIEGFFEHGPVTMLRIGGPQLNEAAVFSGIETGIEFSTHRCRTQLNIELEKNNQEYFARRPLGNHHVIVSGNFKSELLEFLGKLGIVVIN
jgi:L-fucose isomerase-like protein